MPGTERLLGYFDAGNSLVRNRVVRREMKIRRLTPEAGLEARLSRQGMRHFSDGFHAFLVTFPPFLPEMAAAQGF